MQFLDPDKTMLSAILKTNNESGLGIIKFSGFDAYVGFQYVNLQIILYFIFLEMVG